MISFEANSSPFFAANKQFCDSLAATLKPLGADLSGECNSYGYRIEAQFSKSGLDYTILFEKFQTTQNGVIIPKDANEYAGTEFRISGTRNPYKVTLGKNRLKRLFTSKKCKAALPYPYYLFSNHPSQYALEGNLIPFMREEQVDEFKLQEGRALIRIHKPIDDPMPLSRVLKRYFEESLSQDSG